MAYSYDIFISYKRNPETNAWIREHFEPLLALSLELELGRAPSIFRDDRLQDGGTWPVELGLALAGSRVLVPLWTKSYFNSDWCLRELSEMLTREKKKRLRSAARPDGVIVPAVLHDCHDLDPGLQAIQCRFLQDCFNVRMSKHSHRAERLADELQAAAPGIVRAIEAAPAWQASWPARTARAFARQLRASAASQATPPGFAQ